MKKINTKKKREKNTKKVAFLVPAHNEEKVIEETLKSLLKLSAKKDIYVVNDGSTDNTENASLKYTNHVLNLFPNKGKAGALNQAINHFNLVKKYDFIMPIDADSKLDKNFLNYALPIFEMDKRKKVAAIAGRVKCLSYNFVTCFRLWEYEIGQTIHKAAQAKENAITVCPGPSTIFRSKVFNKISIPEGTVTEDMDLTFQIHRKNLGKILFSNKSFVITQDPENLKDFTKQIDRWYSGFWQVLMKNQIPWGGQMLDLEVSLLAIEGLFNGLISVILLLLLPVLLFLDPYFLLIPLAVDLGLFMIPTLLFTATKHRNLKLFYYLPQLYFLRVLSSLIFLRSFMKVVLGIDFSFSWNSRRYKFKEDSSWAQ